MKHAKGDIDAALATLDREIGQCERGQQRAAAAEVSAFWDARLLDYAFACATYFTLRGRYEEKIVWSEAGREAAGRQGRERDDVTVLNNIANVYRATGRYGEAITAYREALNVYRSLNKEADLAMALGNLGLVYADQARSDEAIAHHQQSLAISQRIGDTASTARTLNNLGIVYCQQGRSDEAIAHYQQSLAITQRLGDAAGTAQTLSNLGSVYADQGRYDQAIDHYQQSLAISRRPWWVAMRPANRTSQCRGVSLSYATLMGRRRTGRSLRTRPGRPLAPIDTHPMGRSSIPVQQSLLRG